jgi:hypothetical protein
MFPTSSIVKHVQKDDDNDRFYAQAEVTLAEDMDHAELQLRDVDSSVHAAPLMNAKAGVNTFHISGNGNSPFKQAPLFQCYASLKVRFLKRPSLAVGSKRSATRAITSVLHTDPRAAVAQVRYGDA